MKWIVLITSVSQTVISLPVFCFKQNLLENWDLLRLCAPSPPPPPPPPPA